MKLVKNIGEQRVADLIKEIGKDGNVEAATTEFSIFGFSEFIDRLGSFRKIKIILPTSAAELHSLWGNESERNLRNKLNAQKLSRGVLNILKDKVELRLSKYPLPQSIIAIEDRQSARIIIGHCPLTAEGLGLAPTNALGLTQISENHDEFTELRKWFESAWDSVPDDKTLSSAFIQRLEFLA